MKRIILIGLACAALAGCDPKDHPRAMSNEEIVAATNYCNDNKMDTALNKAGGFSDGFYVTCVPPELDMMTRLEFLQWKVAKRAQANEQAKQYDKPKKAPVNPESFETKSKVTQ